MIRAVTMSMPMVIGRSRAIVAVGPRPGRTPITVPMRAPRKTAMRFPGVSAMAKPWKSAPMVSKKLLLISRLYQPWGSGITPRGRVTFSRTRKRMSVITAAEVEVIVVENQVRPSTQRNWTKSTTAVDSR